MDPITLVTIIVPIVIGLLGLMVAYIQWRENHQDRAGTQLKAVIKSVVDEETKAIDDRVSDHTLRLSQVGENMVRIEVMFKDLASSLRRTSDDMIEVRTRLGMVGTAVEQLAMNAAKNLHQPDPRRARVDHLLEAFMEGTLTPDERLELRKVLVQIRNFEPNSPPLDFPVYPGEQTAAAILLSTMDLVDPARMATMGHAAHRSHGSTTTTTTVTTSSQDPGE